MLPRPSRGPARPPARRFPRSLPGLLTGAAVLGQIAHPLLRGENLRRATIGSVGVFCAAALADTARRHGPGAAARTLVVAGGVGLLAEVVGTRTGRPFGRYRYAGTLGPQVLDVPVVVPLAWTMMAAPALQLGRTLAPTGRWHSPVAVGAAAWTLATWDLFLDPQMTAAGHWAFAEPDPHLPGVPGIPLSNYAGWVLTSLLLCAGLHRAVPAAQPAGSRPAAQAVPGWLLGWTWLGSTLANAAFFGRPRVAGYGGVAMGLTVGPYLARIRRSA
ncbi:carotenoid biosynthesis protein [Kineococcus gynurae]|uniref:Carotenoid biosynthesis protein n=1 Tax=Kineococcus gynurae TaxID=452979 RepID=A0ABV5LUE2_9ACTN